MRNNIFYIMACSLFLSTEIIFASQKPPLVIEVKQVSQVKQSIFMFQAGDHPPLEAYITEQKVEEILNLANKDLTKSISATLSRDQAVYKSNASLRDSCMIIMEPTILSKLQTCFDQKENFRSTESRPTPVSEITKIELQGPTTNSSLLLKAGAFSLMILFLYCLKTMYDKHFTS